MIEYIDNYEILKSFPVAGNEISNSKTNNTLNYVLIIAGGFVLGYIICQAVNEYKMNNKMEKKIRI